ncbi:MAG TPA: 7-carboxy-7-deazaguanine synthase QueE [Cytophagales bacterium]|nr:7-carboxy-7-deazaguanine synthase QueE [Cytophagales bacterium]HAA18176.1 7-carboxy-7-deazaguanine synthase QueE [Cytophagales bacterium]HAP59770.1 7-carboxy-7-deazaguanine synthase QueE [Cytophagales bacterium]
MKISKNQDGPEIFYSIQGEGLSFGIPSVFVRTSLCNLHCFWCDTDYTWNWENTNFKHRNDGTPGYKKFRKEDQIVEMDTHEVFESIRQYPTSLVVLTGGEPLVQQNALADLMEMAEQAQMGWKFEVETNGTVKPNPAFDGRIDQYNVSPKLSNAGMAQSLRIDEGALTFFAASPKASFKFVVANPEDLDEVMALAHKFSIDYSRILLMPEGNSVADQNAKAEWVVEECKQHGFRFSSRLHVHIWGSKRGI